jgi:hypothetical protein
MALAPQMVGCIKCAAEAPRVVGSTHLHSRSRIPAKRQCLLNLRVLGPQTHCLRDGNGTPAPRYSERIIGDINTNPIPDQIAMLPTTNWSTLYLTKRRSSPVRSFIWTGGKDNAQYFEVIPNDQDIWRTRDMKVHPKLLEPLELPGEQQRQKDDLMIRATKFFSYGYEPATGTKFTVLEIGDVDEDEEDYGEYQVDRLEGVGVGEKTNIWEWDTRLEDVKEHDEYAEKLASRRKS